MQDHPISSERETRLPLVSVLICNYNYGRFIASAIESVLAQSYPNIEAIVVDDGSTDDSREIIERYVPRVRAVFQKNSGQCAAFNSGFRASSGEIICLLDSDDHFSPSKVEKIVDCYRAYKDAGYVFHPLRRVGLDGFDFGIQEPMDGSRRLDYRHKANKFTAPPTSGLTFRRYAFEQLVPLPSELRLLPDNYMKFVTLASFPGYYLAEPLATLRLHGDNTFSMGNKSAVRFPEDVRIAHAMRTHFPALVDKADRLVSMVVAKRWRSDHQDDATVEQLRAYLRQSSSSSRARIYAGAALRYLKHSFAAPDVASHPARVGVQHGK